MCHPSKVFLSSLKIFHPIPQSIPSHPSKHCIPSLKEFHPTQSFLFGATNKNERGMSETRHQVLVGSVCCREKTATNQQHVASCQGEVRKKHEFRWIWRFSSSQTSGRVKRELVRLFTELFSFHILAVGDWSEGVSTFISKHLQVLLIAPSYMPDKQLKLF